MLQKFSYRRAASIKEAAYASARPGARVLAGGTDLLGCLRDGVLTASAVVSLSGLKEIKGLSARSGGGLRIGALTTLTEIAGDRQVLRAYPALAQAAASAASPQLRNQGTIGGNIRQRPRGVRMALGAPRASIARIVVYDAGATAGFGMAIGLVAAFGLTRLMKAILYGVSATDPLTFIAVPATLALIAISAAYVPAVRATGADPLKSLRCE